MVALEAVRSCRALRVVGLVVALASSATGAAELSFEHLGPEHGLAHNTANSIVQDRRGFIWIATDDGLDRYDGYELRHFRVDPAAGSSNVFMVVLEDGAGALWVGSRSGLLRFTPAEEAFEAIELPGSPSPSEREIRAIAEDSAGRLWVARGNELFVSERGPVAPFRLALELDGSEDEVGDVILEIEIGPEGQPWLLLGDVVFRSTAVARLEPDSGHLERYPLGGEQAVGRAFYFDRRGELWLAAARNSPQLAVAHPLPDGIPDSVGVDVVAEGEDGVVWLGTMGGGLYRMRRDDPASLERHRLGGTWQENYILDLLIDRVGSVWASTLAGVWRYDPGAPAFGHIGMGDGRGEGLGAPAVSAIRQAADGDLWVGTFGGGLARVDRSTGTIEAYRHDPSDEASLCDDTVWALHLDGAHRLWVAGGEALCVFEPGSERFERVPIPSSMEPPLSMRVLGEVDGTMLVGLSLDGLYLLDPETHRFRPLVQTGTQLTSLEVVGPNEVWLGYHTGLLVALDYAAGHQQRFELRDSAGRPLSHLTIYDIERAPDGHLWLATSGGLARFEPRSERLDYPVAAAVLPGTVCFSARLDRDGDLWVGTNQGLARLSGVEASMSRALVFDLEDGLGNIEFNRGAVYRGDSGEMFFGGMTGLTMFRPEEVRSNPVPPPVVLTRVSILGPDGERSIVPETVERLVMTPEDSAVSFEFAALNYIASRKNRYLYRLDDLDPDWVDSGRRRFARYAGIPPGEYVFRVRGSNNRGVWSEQDLALPLTVLPTFWQTGWFRLLVAMGVAAILYLIYRMRLRRLRELERVRLGIASDLHDELSGELSAIALSSAMARRRDYLEEPERRRLEEIESTSRDVITGLRDLVWAIDPEHDTLAATVRRMRATAAQLLEGLDWTFDEDWTARDGGLPMSARRDLYLILKEALTNVVRHGRAARVAVRLERSQQRLRLEVEDDGEGFEPAVVESGSGLASMRRRAERLGGDLTVDSSPGSGTVIRFEVAVERLGEAGENSGWSRRRRRS